MKITTMTTMIINAPLAAISIIGSNSPNSLVLVVVVLVVVVVEVVVVVVISGVTVTITVSLALFPLSSNTTIV